MTGSTDCRKACARAAAFGIVLPALALAATPPIPQLPPLPDAAPAELEELTEVIVSGEKPTRKVADLIPWIRRLLGEYDIEGHVHLGGKNDPEDQRLVRGTGLCVGFGLAPGVQCEIHVNWRIPAGASGPGTLAGASYLTPAMILYGVEPDERGIRYLQVDNRGLAEGATGAVVGSTASFTTACVDVPQGCQRVTRITALPDSQHVQMQVDTLVDGQLALRYRFQLTRVAEVQAPAATAPESGR